ncbi:MAG: GNAT family protein [Verrucomicrobiae bacterium]|nr:GNAT family protein [Verrucomicrobiae bacterium]
MNQINNSRVIIRPSEAGDCEAFLTAVRRSRAVHGSWINRKAKTPAEYQKYLEKCEKGANHFYCVFHRETGGLVGVINLNNPVLGVLCSASVGYYAFAPYAGQGLMGEGLQLVLRQAFTKHKLHRVEADIQPKNRASLALAKKCGFVKEGFSRRFAKIRGRWRDHERWAILAEDFRKRK